LRKLLFFILFLLILGPSGMTEERDESSLSMMLDPVQFFIVNNAGPLTYTLDSYSDFNADLNIGNINYDLISNSAWEVNAQIRDDSTGGQNPDDWDDDNWTLSVNGVPINESGETVIDSDTEPVDRTGATWEVLLNIPWPEEPSNPDCTILLTASTI